MIRYSLRCEQAHSFDMWFRDSETFDSLAAGGLIACPDCGSTSVSKALMAPSVSPARKPDSTPAELPRPRDIAKALNVIREKVMSETTDVGRDFPDQARQMHQGETEHRPIRGQATADEVRSLSEDGVPVMPVPPEPPKEN